MPTAVTSRTSTATPRVVVVGAGPAGLAAAAALGRRGVPALVLEQSARLGATWRGAYDRLRLNTSRLTSRVAGEPYPAGAGLFPSRDVFVAYLDRFAESEALDLRLGTRVQRLERRGNGWLLITSGGDVLADQVVVATGYANEPIRPGWPGAERFEGLVQHSADYRDARPMRGRDVLVAGAGSSGMEIAYDLVEGGAAQVWLAVRSAPNIVLRAVGGLPGDLVGIAMLKVPARLADRLDRGMRRIVLGDLRPYGLPTPREGTFARLERLGVGPAVIDRDVLSAIKDGRIRIVAAVAALDATGAELSDGTRIEPDAIIAATGYRCGLEPLVGHLDVLDERGVPLQPDGAEAAPGLRFIGFVPVPGQIRRMSADARRVASDIARQCAAVRRP